MTDFSKTARESFLPPLLDIRHGVDRAGIFWDKDGDRWRFAIGCSDFSWEVIVCDLMLFLLI